LILNFDTIYLAIPTKERLCCIILVLINRSIGFSLNFNDSFGLILGFT